MECWLLCFAQVFNKYSLNEKVKYSYKYFVDPPHTYKSHISSIFTDRKSVGWFLNTWRA